jgi:large subunit ribosomal protein L17
MRHRNSGRKLSRNSSHRHAMLRNMVTSLFESERIQTTDAKAKELRRVAERLITLSKKNALSVVAAAANDDEKARREGARLAAVRQAGRVVRGRPTLQKLFSELAERYQERPGGYTRILRVGRRLGDGAEMVIIELVDGAGQSAPAADQGESTEATA